MKIYSKLLFFIFLLYSPMLICQTGPSGVGNSSNNIIWLDAHMLGLPNGSNVAAWPDLSGNGSNFTIGISSRQPTYRVSGINSTPSIRFDGVNDVLKSGSISSLETPNLTYFIVYDRTTTTTDMIITAKYASDPNKWRTYMNAGQNTIISAHYSPTIKYVRYTDPPGASFFSSHITPTSVRTYNQGVVAMTKSATYSLPSSHLNVFLGNQSDLATSSYTYTGEIAEVIVYNSTLTDLQRIMVENYLGAKYQMAIPTDLYDYDFSHKFGLIGIGNDGVNSQIKAQGAGILELSLATDLGSDEYFVVAHTDFQPNEFNLIDLPISLPEHQRMERTWRVGETGETGTTTLTFFLGADDFAASDSYRLLVDTDGTFIDATALTGTYNAFTSSVSFAVNLNDGDFFTLAGIQSILEIHSITDGDWNTTSTWDCGCIPSVNDLVFIEPTTTVTIDDDAFVDDLIIELGGTLEMNTDATLLLKGDFQIFGTCTFNDGTLFVGGDTPQLIFNSATSPTPTIFENININNTGFADVTFSGGIFLLKGTLSPNKGNIIFNPTTEFIITSTSATEGGRVGPIIAPTVISGNVTVQRFIAPGLADWRNLCSPVVGSTFDDWDPDLAMSGPDFPDGCASGPDEPCFKSVKYTEHTTLFTVLSSTEPILNGRGFEIFVGTSVDLFDGTTLNSTGPLNNSGAILKSFATGWTIVGNPYASPITYNTITKTSSISKYFYVYDANSGAYQWYDQTSGTSSTPEITAAGLIATGQAVWVFATSIGTMTFEQTNKSSANATFIRGATPINNSVELRLSEKSTDYHCSVQLEPNELGTLNYDESIDILDFRTGTEKAPGFYFSLDDNAVRKNYIQTFENWGVFPLCVAPKRLGEHLISLSNFPQMMNLEVYLIDNMSSDTINLENTSHEFYVNDITKPISDRFELLIRKVEIKETIDSNAEIELQESIEITQQSQEVFAYNHGNNPINVRISIISMLGQEQLITENLVLQSGRNKINLPNGLNGTYIIKFSAESLSWNKIISITMR